MVRKAVMSQPVLSEQHLSRVAELRDLFVVDRSKKVDTPAFFACSIGRIGFWHCFAMFLKFVEETKI
ncbi:hypothetical protein Y032_0482g2282 [Ancylostoma ceylanicum]|nr:hypothetical protein Y032_0482g2282 [Ancylostoma ceylanicum]